MLKLKNLLVLNLVLIGVNAQANQTFAKNKQDLVNELARTYKATGDLTLDMAVSMLEVPKQLGLVDVTDDYGLHSMEGEGGGQHGPEISVKEGVVKMENSAPTYRAARSKVFCSKETEAKLAALKAKDEYKVLWKEVDASCLEVYVMANVAGNERLTSSDYAYTFDLKTRQISMEPTEQIIKVYVLDRSRGEEARGYSGFEPFLGSRRNLDPDFQITKKFEITAADVTANLFALVVRNYEAAYANDSYTAEEGKQWVQFRNRLESAINSASFSEATLAELEKLKIAQLAFAKENHVLVAMLNALPKGQFLTSEQEDATPEGLRTNAAQKIFADQQTVVLNTISKNNDLDALAFVVSKLNGRR